MNLSNGGSGSVPSPIGHGSTNVPLPACPYDRPQVLLIDDMPVYGRDLDGEAGRDAGFYVLAAAKVRWSGIDPFQGADVVTELRLLRAYAKSNTAAWRLMFDELGCRRLRCR